MSQATIPEELSQTHDDQVLISIEAPLAYAILDATKRFEYRRSAPAIDAPFELLIYASKGPGAVVGTADVVNVVRDGVDAIVQRTDPRPSSPADVREYLRGGASPGALALRNPTRIEPTPLAAVPWLPDRPPENFSYVGAPSEPTLSQWEEA